MITTVTNGVVAEPPMYQAAPGHSLAVADSATLVKRAELASKPVYEFTKRAFDIHMALVALVIAAPLFVVLAIAVKLSSPGPILFRHTRIDKDGQPFTMIKFRTMGRDADLILELDAYLRARFVTSFKLKEDCRVTGVGRVLRKLSLDELPQFINILRGDMSWVGPRPKPADELRSKCGHVAARLVSVRPGLTGLWQVSGRCTTDYDERNQLDLTYIAKRSLLLDLWIILRTPIALVTMRGAH